MTTTRLHTHHLAKTSKSPTRRLNRVVTSLGAIAALLASASCQPTPPASPTPASQDDHDLESNEPSDIAPNLRKFTAPSPPAKTTKKLPRRRPVTDRSCRVDQDCVVKDVGSCCGRHPQCVNRSFHPNPAAVQAACRDQNLMSTCGYVEIAGCHCVANRCENTGSGDAVR